MPRLSPPDRWSGGTVFEANSSNEALQLALARTPPDGLICIAGSLYLIGEMRPSILKLRLEQPT